MEFEWDDRKNIENLQKHSVGFDEAADAFNDPKRIILKDEKHSDEEDRYFCIGKTSRGVCTVRFTVREGNVRIIGAGYWRRQRKYYEQSRG